MGALMIPERLRWLTAPDSLTLALADLFDRAGHGLYLVGGSVRDAFLDRLHEDLDFTTDAHPEAIRKIIGKWATSVYTVGEAFGTIELRKGDLHAQITTFRREVYRSDSRKPRVEFSDRIEEDLSRRDFTVNAMAMRLPDLELIDPFDGRVDLAASLLKTPLDPEISFSDDPLRMLRMYRFHATLDFAIDPETEAAASRMADRLGIISQERIRDELSRLLLAEAPGSALFGLVRSGLAAQFLPELPGLAMEQDPHHQHKDVLAHTIAVVEQTAPNLELRLAALLHDIGKPATRAFGPDGVSFHHHEVVGARMARERLRELRYPKSVVDEVAGLVSLHLRPHTLKMGWTDSAVRRYVRDAGPLLGHLNELVRCDITTANPRKAETIRRRLDELEIRIVELGEREEIGNLRPPIDGHQVMTYLSMPPGRAVGEVLEILYERRIEDGPYSVAEAYRMVREWALADGRPDPGPSPEP
jgi:poly(A) polymerase